MRQPVIVRGPYQYAKGTGRLQILIYFDDGTKKTTAYAKYLVENYIGRELTDDETVDHIDKDPSNDALDNLGIAPWGQHRAIDRALTQEHASFTCPLCGNPATRPARFVRHAWNQGKTGPFCSKRCSGRASRVTSSFPRPEVTFWFSEIKKPWKSVLETFPQGIPIWPEPHVVQPRVRQPRKSRSRGIRRPRGTVPPRLCVDCGATITQSAKARCRPCSYQSTERIDWPDTTTLIQMVAASNYSAVGRELGVTDNAIRKRIAAHP